MRRDYVELNRTFLDFSDELDIEGAAWKSYFAGLSGGLDWGKLLQSKYVVILGEAGSGKTWELEAQTEKLRKRSINSFFIRIETLASQSFAAALDANDLEAFSKWQESRVEATFFLDSVDEAKLQKPQAFHDALNSFAKGIGLTALNRARVVITCRVSEWRGKADLFEVRQRFAISEEQTRGKNSYSRNEVPPPLLRVVQLAPLDTERVSQLASHYGIADTDVFIKAIDSSDLWDFAGRPKDVENLIAYWRENKSLGSISQMVEYDTKCKLRETESRDRMAPLSADKAMHGAQALAAAVVLCRRFTFAIPDEPVDPALAATAIDPSDVLSDWKSEHIRALLSRAIFDEATYGRVRFHHRSIAEYLAAKWVILIQANGCPLRSIENIIFGEAHGKEVVRPSLVAIAAWLSVLDWPWRKIILDRVIRINPDVLVNYGDPQLLPLEARLSILESIFKRYEGRRRVRIDTPTAQLRRLAHDDLASAINRYLIDKTLSQDIRELFLRMIGHGKLANCVATALEIIADEEEDESLRYYAVDAVVENAGEKQLGQLVNLVTNYKEISQRMCTLLLQTLYPKMIGVKELIQLIDKTRIIPQMSAKNLPDALSQLIANAAPAEHLPDMLPRLIMLIEQHPRIKYEGDETPISSRFSWLGSTLYAVVRRLLMLSSLDGESISYLGRAIFLLDKIKKLAGDYRENNTYDLQKTSESHPAVRRAYVRERVADLRARKKEAEANVYSVFGYYSVLRLSEVDCHWLLEDISGEGPDQDKELFLNLAISLWYQLGRPKAFRLTLEDTVRDKPNLQKILRQYIPNLLQITIGRIKSRIYQFQHRDRYEIRRKVLGMVNHLARKWRGLYSYLWCITHIRDIRSGKHIWSLYWLATHFKSGRTVSAGAEDSWQDLVADFGTKVADAAREGWKTSWRKFRPPLPHERQDQNKTDIRVTVGLKGIKVDVEDGLEIALLSNDEASLAALYALYDWNKSPNWFTALALSHPDQIKAILNRCIEIEWLTPAEKGHVGRVLSSILDSEEILRGLISPRLLELIRNGDPSHEDVLRQVLILLLLSNDVSLAELVALASQRIRNYPSEDNRFISWLLTWLSIEGSGALNFLEEYLQTYPDEADRLIEKLGAVLCGHHGYRYPSVEKPSFLDVNCLSRFIVLFYRHVRPEDDLDRSEGVFSPTTRDDAQTFRSRLVQMLFQSQDKSAYAQIRSLLNEPLLSAHKDYLLSLLDERSGTDAEGAAWQAGDVPVFAREYETQPRSADPLFRIVCNRLVDIKDIIERGDFSLRAQFKPADPEETLQKWLADRLTSTANGKYEVVREAEVDRGKEPDILIVTPKVERLPIEVKWAHKWSFGDLEKALIEQLIDQYMRENDSRHGIYVVCNADPARRWERAISDRIDFSTLAEYLRRLANVTVSERGDMDGLGIVDIDFTTS